MAGRAADLEAGAPRCRQLFNELCVGWRWPAITERWRMSGADRQHDPGSNVNAGNNVNHDAIDPGRKVDQGHQTEQEHAAEQRFRLVVEAAPSAMVMVDPTGAIV